MQCTAGSHIALKLLWVDMSCLPLWQVARTWLRPLTLPGNFFSASLRAASPSAATTHLRTALAEHKRQLMYILLNSMPLLCSLYLMESSCSMASRPHYIYLSWTALHAAHSLQCTSD